MEEMKMKRIFIATFLLAAFVVSAETTIGQTNAKLETEIGKLLRNFYDAVSRRDETGAMSIFADNGFFYSVGGGYSTSEKTKEEFRTYLRSSSRQPPPRSKRIVF